MIAPAGFQIGPYLVLEPIGRGGMADVFIADDTRTSRRVALKLVPIADDPEARQIVEAEREGAEYQKQLWQVYRQVPEVYEYASHGAYFYIAMEFLDGQNLSEVIQRGAMPARRAAAIAIQICRFLEAAHTLEPTIDGRKQRSLLHGDLKPRNIRILANDEVKVFDFGAAKALSFSRKVTRHDFGSIAYLSPERIESGEIDAHADFWGVGVILYEMVGGMQPFQASDTRRLELKIRARVPPAPLDHGCPDGLQAVVSKLLAGRQQDRYDSAQAIREDLESALAGTETVAEREGWPAKVHDEPATERVTIAPSDEEATRRTLRSSSSAVTGVVSNSPALDAQNPRTSVPARVDTVEEKKLQERKRWIRRVLARVVAVWVFAVVANEMRVGLVAGRLADRVPALELTDLGGSWLRFQDLRSPSLGIGTSRLDRTLLRQTLMSTDRIIANYRTPSPTVREAQWRAARDVLARAVAFHPDDQRLKASLRYCEGHLHRIDGDARKARKLPDEAQSEFADALVAFREAADLRQDWPDPYLGLMRVFIYGLNDVERGADALDQAKRRGYVAGDRETAQLAEGHRLRAETLVRSARELSGMTQELQYLNRAADEYRQALELYSEVPTLADTARQLRAIQRALAATEQRIAALSNAPAERTSQSENQNWWWPLLRGAIHLGSSAPSSGHEQ
jgi:serine/threonine protein kinase/tetratricopeptide (TPR) repeat protein